MTRVIVALAIAIISTSVAPAQIDYSKGLDLDAESIQKMLAYKLNPSNLRHFLDATRTITAMATREPTVKKGFRNHESFIAQNKGKISLSAWAAAFDQLVPAVSAAMRRAGLTPHDFFLVVFIFVQQVSALAVPSPDLPPGLSRENAAFVREHSQEMRDVMMAFARATVD
jgi:hypothetical protein